MRVAASRFSVFTLLLHSVLCEYDERPVVWTEDHAGVLVSDRSVDGLPKVRLNGRVNDLVSGIHFDGVQQDTPGDVRPGSAVVFYDSSKAECMATYDSIGWDTIAEEMLPSRAWLFTGRYAMLSAPRRAWFKFTPEMDLAARFGISACPQLVYVCRTCSGFTDWCSRGFLEEGIE